LSSELQPESHVVFAVATLGQFKKYSSVFYRVYLPSRDERRTSYVVASNLGILAITAAHLHAARSNGGSGVEGGARAVLLLLVPPTLPHDPNPGNVKGILNDPKEYLSTFWRELKKKIREDYYAIKKCIKENSSVAANLKENEVIAVNIDCEDNSEKRSSPPQQHKPELALPYVVRVDGCKVRIERYVRGEAGFEESSVEEYPLTVYLGLVPLTGTYKHNNTLLIYREAQSSLEYLERFNDAVKAAYLNVIRIVGEDLASEKGSEENIDVKLLFDTTHGLNSMVAMLSQVKDLAAPLTALTLELLSEGGYRVSEVLSYNSDPVTQQAPTQSTAKSNVSYYYTVDARDAWRRETGEAGVVAWRLSQVLESVERLLGALLSSGSRERLESVRKSKFYRRVKGLYLISKGLIPWGLYEFEEHAEQDAAVCKHPITYKVEERRDTLMVKYSVNRDTCHPSDNILSGCSGCKLSDVAVAGWIAELAVKGLRSPAEAGKSLLDTLKLEPSTSGGGVCWSRWEAPAGLREGCYTFSGVRAVLRGGAGNLKGAAAAALGMLSSLIPGTTRLIVENELDEFREKPEQRLYYMSPQGVFEIRREGGRLAGARCSSALRVAGVRARKRIFEGGSPGLKVESEGEEVTAYCVTPMTVQHNIRNIVAHGGLTSVHRLVGVAFVDDNGGCRAEAFCIASPFPEDHLKELLEGGRA